jgi:hypothetical protein
LLTPRATLLLRAAIDPGRAGERRLQGLSLCVSGTALPNEDSDEAAAASASYGGVMWCRLRRERRGVTAGEGGRGERRMVGVRVPPPRCRRAREPTSVFLTEQREGVVGEADGGEGRDCVGSEEWRRTDGGE